MTDIAPSPDSLADQASPHAIGRSDADRLVLVQLKMAIGCFTIAIVGGMLGSLHYVPSLSADLAESGVTLQKLRPIHTTFASLWIFGGAIAVMYHYLSRLGGGLSKGDRARFWFHTACWGAAGAAILITISQGIFSGREYIGFHWSISAVLLAGWVAFAINFLRRIRETGFWNQPIYLWFWSIGVLFFMYTFAEGHAYLLPSVEKSPIRDLQVQWKSCGTLVGSFNFLIYGALIYISERLSGDKKYAQSGLAFALFGVGCLNSFTNYAHHTYHLPQNETIKWIAFVVSMAEIIILARIMFDLAKAVRARMNHSCMAARYFGSAKWWTAGMLFSSLLISVPSWNSIIHGTHAVMGHAMGAELGIDSMVLFGAVAFLLVDLRGTAQEERLGCGRMRAHLVILNIAIVTLVGWLTVSGVARGWASAHGQPIPDWITLGKYVFPVAGGLLALSLLWFLRVWIPGFRAPAPSGDSAAAA